MSVTRNSMLRRLCSVVLVACLPAIAVVASCSSQQADTAGNGTIPGTGPTVCSLGVEGCPCDQGGATVECGKVLSKEGDYVTCSMGHTQCIGGQWGACEGDRILTKSVGLNLSAGGAVHTLQHSVPCTNACDPNGCQSASSDLTDVVAPGLQTGMGGISLVLDGSAGPACVGLQCEVKSCGGNPSLTSIKGFVYDPAGKNPLYGITVYIPVDPNGILPAFTPGASTATCGGAGSIVAVTSTTTAPDGSFTLTGVPSGLGLPVGNGIPIVMQSGKWRREIFLDHVTSCASNNTIGTGPGDTGCTAPTAAADCTMRLPRNQQDGWDPVTRTYTKADIPKMAIVSGGADPFECLLLKIGIDPNEFGSRSLPAQKPRAVHFYESPDATATIFSNRDKGQALYNASPSILPEYDAVMLPCEGGDYDKLGTRANAAQGNQSGVTPAVGTNPYASMINYMNIGGRAFATHFSYYWLEFPSKYTYVPGPAAANWGAVATWHHAGTPTDPLPATVNQGFAGGSAFAQWLVNVSGGALGKVSIHAPRHDLSDTLGAFTQDWLNAVDNGSNPSDYAPLITFDTPYPSSMPVPPQYGRVVFSDFHVSNAAITQGTACTVNPDCGYGQTCGGAFGGGYPGTCTEKCFSPKDCGSTGYSCSGSGGTCQTQSCRRNSDCASNSCNGGTKRCNCTTGAQCGSGVCSAGACTVAPACTDDSQCGTIQQCNGVSEGVCSKSCATNADCSAGGELCMSSAAVVNTAASYVQPAVGGSVVIKMVSTASFRVGQTIHVKTGGTYVITAIASPNLTATLQLTGDRLATGGTVASGKNVEGDCTGGLACSCKGCLSASSCTSNDKAPTCTGASVTSGTCTPAMPAGAFTGAASATGPWGWFPYACQQSPMTDQEKALEFMFFNLTSCVTPSAPPPPPPTYAAATFTQDYTANCTVSQKVVWREFDWQAVIPTTSKIAFSAQSGPNVAGLLNPTPVPLFTATTSTPIGVPPPWDIALIDTSNGLGGAGTGPFNTAMPPVKSDKLLRMTITMSPTTDMLSTPVLLQWKVQYDCVAAE
ncbi:MAG: Tryptophan synthase alpha chain [Myxococcaceae bacterium]|jgi:hypothetical protein|nr:Tryptophan synthase alpha chain [Myxococcaceae bacterium]MEA2748923.1 hypothetical protein [Myxococcales bacterium]